MLILVLKDSLRTYFKSLSLSWFLGVRSLSLWVRSRSSLSLSWSLGEGHCPCPGGHVFVCVLVLGGQVLVLVLVLGGQVLVNIPESNHFRTYFLYMIRYNSISRPVYDSSAPSATLPATPLPKTR